MPDKSLPEVTVDLYNLLSPLSSQDRRKVVSSAFALFDDGAAPSVAAGSSGHSDPNNGADSDFNGRSLGPNASRWMKQNGITREILEHVFHIDPGVVTIIADSIPGGNMSTQTANAYVLEGIRALLANDQASFQEGDVVTLCKHLGCHNVSNHAAYRRGLGNKVTGSKQSGYTLPAPGLKAGAELVRQLAAKG